MPPGNWICTFMRWLANSAKSGQNLSDFTTNTKHNIAMSASSRQAGEVDIRPNPRLQSKFLLFEKRRKVLVNFDDLLLFVCFGPKLLLRGGEQRTTPSYAEYRPPFRHVDAHAWSKVVAGPTRNQSLYVGVRHSWSSLDAFRPRS